MEKSRPGFDERVQSASPQWHAEPIDSVESAARTNRQWGLTSGEAAARLEQDGPNEIRSAKAEPWWEEVAESLTEPLVLLLLGVAVVYALVGALGDALTILAVILLVAAVEVANESRAKKAISSLRTLTAPTATVIRSGDVREIPARDLVSGDLVLLGPGTRVPADLRLVESVGLRLDEASLTGESAPVTKQADTILPPGADLGDRRNLAFAGTLVTAGRGRGIAVATGRNSELGRIVRLAEQAREPRTPLQLHLRQLAGWLLWLAVGFSVLIPLLAIVIAHRSVQESVLTGLTLAFATIPEELPILVTIVLGLGAYHLAQRHAVVKRLRAAETLGSVSVVGTDKTGTLTENQLVAVEAVTGDGQYHLPVRADTPGLRHLYDVAAIANDAQFVPSAGNPTMIGDPTEVALLVAAEQAGQSVEDARASAHILAEFPFEHTRRRMSVIYTRGETRWLALKGSPEAVLALCSGLLQDGRIVPLDAERRGAMLAKAEEMAARGLRVLAGAERQLGSEEPDEVTSETALTFVGLIGLEDPPRREVPAAIATLKRAGVRVLMLTGDHPATARAVAERVGIDASRVVVGQELDNLTTTDLRQLLETASVFARISPEHKFRIVRLLEEAGKVVAVTGDGVNDAPALREAAVGIAMGRVGTDVAREAADLVLADDNFATVAVAVRDGRTLYANLRKAVRYYLAAKVALILSSLVPVLAALAIPFAPVQIIVMELFMDLGASTTFVAEPAEKDVMDRPPRDPHRPFMDRSMQLGIFGGGVSLAVTVLVSFYWVLGHDGSLLAAQSAAFAAWLLGHLVLAAHMRSEHQPLTRLGLATNRAYFLWVAGVLVLLALGTTVPFVKERLHLTALSLATWGIVVGSALVFPSWWEIFKLGRWRGEPNKSLF